MSHQMEDWYQFNNNQELEVKGHTSLVYIYTHDYKYIYTFDKITIL